MNTPNLTREEWAEELLAVSTDSDRTDRIEYLRIIDSITRQAKVEALEWAERKADDNAASFTATDIHAEINRLKEKV